MNGKYVGNRPVQLRKSKWKDRIDYEALVKKNESSEKAKSPKKSVLHKRAPDLTSHSLIVGDFRCILMDI
ncbi:hypothetical protein K7X08_017113 [Anisodus acutangulus]|uniref:Uncharacterized protein n=1 Tax=Anisodus acutangulus TaxID=402998 RepID=A0A9Q1LU18_9SOLA|nr:hypothetical protein K7X08_017113 [Anisodus acutangulus]